MLTDPIPPADCRALMDPISAMHVYSVAPLQHLDALSLWQDDHLQSQVWSVRKESFCTGEQAAL
jgi:hypothetical protein